MKKWLFVLAGALLILLSPSMVFSQSTWTGGAGPDWTNPGSWAGGVPGPGTNVVIPVTVNKPDLTIAPVSPTINNLSIDSGATITMGPQTLIVQGNLTTTSAGGNYFSITSGTLQVNGTSSIQGNITATGAATITLTGAVTVNTANLIISTVNGPITFGSTVAGFAGTESLNANAGAGIVTLSGAVSNLTGLTVTTGAAIALPATTLTGNLSVTAGGAITQSGILSVTGTTTLAAGAGNTITLNNGGNILTGAVIITSGLNVSVVDSIALNLGASTVSGTLSATATGAITQSGILSVTGTTTLAAGAGNNITLNNGGNILTGAVIITSGLNVSVVDSIGLNLGASTVSGNLAVTAGGNIINSGNLIVTGTSSFTVPGGNSITLNSAGNSFTGAMSFIASAGTIQNVTVVDILALNLPAMTLLGNLNVTAAGITQAGALVIPVTMTLAAGAGNNITLNNAGNSFTGVVIITSGNNVSVMDSLALLTLGASTVSGNLSVTGVGIIQGGALSVTGTTTLVAGAGNNITLNNAGNSFTGAVSITNGLNVNIVDSIGLNLGASTVSGTLSATAGGNIINTGNLIVTGTSTFTVPNTNSITLNSLGNSFTGAVSFLASAGTIQNVTVMDILALNLSALTLLGNLNVTAAGITQGGALVIPGTTTLAAGALNITLNNVGNSFTGAVSITSGLNVNVVDSIGLNLEASTVSGNLAVTSSLGNILNSGNLIVTGTSSFTVSGGNSITLNSAGNAFTGAMSFIASAGTIQNVTVVDTLALNLAALTLLGNLNVTAAGISQGGALVIPGTTTLKAGALNNITLNNGGNHFTGAVTISSGLNVNVVDALGLLDLGGSTVSGTLSVTGVGIIQGGALSVIGTTTLAAGANNITLNLGNSFTGAVSITSGLNVNVVNSIALVLGASTVSGTLSATAAGAITQIGPASVALTTTVAAGAANNITLSSLGNSFTGAVIITSGLNVNVLDFVPLVLGASTVSGNLVATVLGAITQVGAVSVAATTTLAAGAANNITLNNVGNSFVGAVSITSGNNVTLVDSIGLNLGASTVSGNLLVTAGANITNSGNLVVTGTSSFTVPNANSITLNSAGNSFTGAMSFLASVGTVQNVTVVDILALNLSALTLLGNLDVTAAGITQIGALVIPGTTTLVAGALNNITLNLGNSFTGAVIITSGLNVNVVDSVGLVLGFSTVSGNLSATGVGITQVGAVSVAGTTTLVGGALNNITLNNVFNSFTGAVSITSGNTVNVVDSIALVLGASTVSGNLSARGVGISQTGAVSVLGTTTLTGGAANNITLVIGTNIFTGAVAIFSGNNVNVLDSIALDLGASTVSGTLTATGAGITQSGPLSVTGATTLTAGAANNITLNSLLNSFTGAVSIFSGKNVVVNDFIALVLGASTVSGTLSATGAGITQVGAVSVAGTTTLLGGALNNITLNLGNSFTGAVAIFSGNNVDVVDSLPLILGACTVSGTLMATGAGITQSGVLVISGTTTLVAGAANNITLNLGNSLTGAVSITSGNNVTLVDSLGLNLGASTVSGTLTVTSGGNIINSGNLIVTGTSSFTVPGGFSITLNSAGNSFTGAMSFLASVGTVQNVTVVDILALNLSALTLLGNLDVTAAGITQIGALVIPGTTTLTAGALNNITLNLGNSFTGVVTIISGNIVSVVDSVGLILGASTVSGNLSATGLGITQAGAVSVAGTTTLVAGLAITLNNAGNIFTGAVSLTSGLNASVVDSVALILGASTVSANLSATGVGITQSGILNVSGATTLVGGAANNITLNNAGNIFSATVSITSGLNVNVVDSTSLVLGASTVSANLSATGLSISQIGAVSVTGTTTLTAAAADNITLNNGGNIFTGAVSITSGNTVNVVDSVALVLGASTVSANLSATGVGITQTGALSVTGTTTLAGGAANNITLNLGNSFTGAVTITSGLNVNVVDSVALILGASTVSANLSVTGVGITQTGALSVAGTTTLVGGAANNITLNNVGNIFTGAVSITSGNTVTVVDSIGLNLGASTVSGNLVVTAGGNIINSGNLIVTGTSSFTVPNANSITLNSAGNSFTGAVSFLASVGTIQNVTVVDILALNLSALTLLGNLNVTAAGITQIGALVIPGTTTLAAGAGNITLINAGNSFTGVVSIISGNIVTVVDSIALNLGAPTITGTLSLTAPAITLNGNVTTTGAQSYTGAVTLGASSVLTTAGGAITFSSTITGGGNNLTLVSHAGATTVTGAVNTVNVLTLQDNTVASTGTMTFSGNLSATTLTTFGQAYAVTLSAGGTITNAVTFSNTGALSVGAAGFTFTAGATDIAGAKSFAGGTISAGNAALDFGVTAVTLTGNMTFNPGTGALTLGATAGAFNLVIQGSGGATIVSAALGVGTLNLSLVTGGTITVTGFLTTQAISTAAAAYNITLNGGGTVATATSFLNTGVVSIGNGLQFTGGINTATGPSGTNLGGWLRTVGNTIKLGAVTLTALNTWIDSTNVGASPGNTITIASVAGAGDNLNLWSGSFSTTVAGALSVANLSLELGLPTSTGTMIFNGFVTVTASITTVAQAYAIQFNAGGTITNAATFTNTGALTIAAGCIFANGVTAIAPSSKSIAGVVSAAAGAINLGGAGPITVTGAATIGGATLGPITLASATIAPGVLLTVGSGVATPVTTNAISGAGPGNSNVTFNTTSTVTVNGVIGPNIGIFTNVNAAGIIDVQGNNFTIAALANAGTFRLTGAQGTQSFGAITFTGIVQYYGPGGNILVAVPFNSLDIAGAGTFTLGQPIQVGPTPPVVGTGFLRITSGTLNVNIFDITVNGDWTDLAGNFVAQNGTAVHFNKPAPGPINVKGNNSWFVFDCQVNGTTIVFQSNMFQTMLNLAGATFRVKTGAGNINLTSDNNLPPPPAPPGGYWDFTLNSLAVLDMNNVTLDASKATPYNVPAPAGVTLTLPGIVRCPGWQKVNDVITDVTLDLNHNGKIDRILVTTTLPLTRNAAAFSGFVVKVPGYTLTTVGGSAGTVYNWTDPSLLLTQFWIMLAEQPFLDTGALPAWTVVSDTTLADSGTGTFYVPVGPPFSPLADGAPPILAYTLAAANGQPEIYMHFSEPVFHTGGGAPQLGDIVLHNTVSGVTISGAPIAVSASEFLLPLSAVLTPDDIANPARLTASVASNGAGHGLQDAAGNQLTEAPLGTGHRVSDLGLGLPSNGMMEPMFAHDETQSGPFPGGIGLIQVGGFDGTKWLRNKENITLQGRVQTLAVVPPPTLGNTTLWYDIDVPAADRNGGAAPGVWLPSFFTDDVTVAPPAYGFSGLVPMAVTGDTQARNRPELGSSAGQLRNFLIPGTDAKEHDAAVLDFLFQMTFPSGMQLFTARVVNPAAVNWYQQITPWTFVLRDIRPQRGGVQILNNVIDPDKGQVTTLQFIQGSAGNVTVTVFDLSGSIIRVLLRANQAAGDYGVTWDGTNRSGAKVTRGLYFIRVVGPGMDEIRKVLVFR